jgi:hypothetical protein
MSEIILSLLFNIIVTSTSVYCHLKYTHSDWKSQSKPYLIIIKDKYHKKYMSRLPSFLCWYLERRKISCLCINSKFHDVLIFWKLFSVQHTIFLNIPYFVYNFILNRHSFLRNHHLGGRDISTWCFHGDLFRNLKKFICLEPIFTQVFRLNISGLNRTSSLLDKEKRFIALL